MLVPCQESLPQQQLERRLHELELVFRRIEPAEESLGGVVDLADERSVVFGQGVQELAKAARHDGPGAVLERLADILFAPAFLGPVAAVNLTHRTASAGQRWPAAAQGALFKLSNALATQLEYRGDLIQGAGAFVSHRERAVTGRYPVVVPQAEASQVIAAPDLGARLMAGRHRAPITIGKRRR